MAMMPQVLTAAIIHKAVSPLDYLQPAVRALRPYRPGRGAAEVAAERGIRDVVKLASNENPLGAGELALAALRELPPQMFARYPPGGGDALVRAIARRLSVGEEQVIPGNGSNDILALAGQLILAPGSGAVYSQHSFLVYGLVVAAAGAESVVVADKNFSHDLDAMAEAAQKPKVRLVFVANPNNPTGSWHSPSVIHSFLRRVPQNVLVVLDEAYCDYLQDEGRSSLPLLNTFANLLITRTFSKIHGLAGLRAGYGIGNKAIINALNNIRQPFNINIGAQTAAQAALDDEKHLSRSRGVNIAGMKTLCAGLDEMGFKYLPSNANFLCFAADDAAQVYERLLDSGVIVRRLDDYQMAGYLRITIGTAEENKKFLSALQTTNK